MESCRICPRKSKVRLEPGHASVGCGKVSNIEVRFNMGQQQGQHQRPQQEKGLGECKKPM